MISGPGNAGCQPRGVSSDRVRGCLEKYSHRKQVTLNVAGDLPSLRPCSSDVRAPVLSRDVRVARPFQRCPHARPVLTMSARPSTRARKPAAANFRILANKAGHCLPVLVLNSQHHQKLCKAPAELSGADPYFCCQEVKARCVYSPWPAPSADQRPWLPGLLPPHTPGELTPHVPLSWKWVQGQ